VYSISQRGDSRAIERSACPSLGGRFVRRGWYRYWCGGRAGRMSLVLSFHTTICHCDGIRESVRTPKESRETSE
jgi:hypothetical protein